MKTCKVLITSACNLSCTYCINKKQDIKDQFKAITREKFMDICSSYTSISVSGGEPFLNFPYLERFVSDCTWYNTSKVYVYTNGLRVYDALIRPSGNTLLLNKILDKVKGITVGIHPTQIDRDVYQYINDKLKDKTSLKFIGIKQFLPDGEDYLAGANIRLVELDQDCSNPNEDKYQIV